MTALAEMPGDVQPKAELVALLSKVAAAQRDIGRIEKDKRNDAQHYDYTSIEAIVLGTRDQLLQHGLVVFAELDDLNERQRDTQRGQATVTTVDLRFQIYDIETGYSLRLPWAGRGEDVADKGIAKALTDARKTFLIQQFNIARGDDTEGDTSTDERNFASSTSDTVNLVADAKGLHDDDLNRVLVAAGLPASQKPFGAFTRIPGAAANEVRANLQKLKGSA